MNNELTNNDIIKALSLSDLESFLGQSKEGINTKIKYRSQLLSLGIKKRLALARARLSKGKIIIFDEPTEGLDERGLNLFYNFFNQEIKSGKTLIIFSQDKNLVKIGHNIIDLNKKPTPMIIKSLRKEKK